MTDTTNEEIQLPRDMTTRDMFFYFRDQVTEIDQRLNAGSAQAMRTLAEKDLIAAYEHADNIPVSGTDQTEDVSWKDLSEQIVGFVNKFDSRVKAGLYYGLVSALEDALDKDASAYLTTITPAPSDTDKLKDDEKSALGEQRQNYMKQLRMLKDLNLLMNFATEDEMVLPATRPGLGGTRKREISSFQFFIDNEPVSKEQNKVKIVAELLGYKNQELFKNALMEHLTENKDKPRKDLRDLPDTIADMNTPSGKVFSGKKFDTASTPDVEEPTAENEEDDDDDDDDDDEEETTSAE